jgi:type II secretory pathway component PulF
LDKKTTQKSVIPLVLSGKAILSILVIFFAVFPSFKQLLMQACCSPLPIIKKSLIALNMCNIKTPIEKQ